MITKYNRVPLGFDPSVTRLLGHDPTPRLTCPLYKHITTQHKQHHRNRLQPTQTTRTHNHSSTRHEQSIRQSTYGQSHQTNIPHTFYQIHRKLHQMPQSIHHIQKQNINTTPIQKWCSTRQRAITHTPQHIHI